MAMESRLDIGEEARRKVTHALYDGGHMMYHNRPCLAKLKDDAAAFFESAIPRP